MSQPRKDGVEMMINELVQTARQAQKIRPTASRRGRRRRKPLPSRRPSPPRRLPPEEELEALIGGEEVMKNRTSTARLFLAKALLAQARNDPQMRDTYYDQLGEFEASELSPYLLGQMAEYFLGKAEAARIPATRRHARPISTAPTSFPRNCCRASQERIHRTRVCGSGRSGLCARQPPGRLPVVQGGDRRRRRHFPHARSDLRPGQDPCSP